MTVVACWVNGETDPAQVCAVSDSRLRGRSVGVLSDSVAKIFSIPLICRRPGPSGFFDTVHFSSSVGMAVAGSALVNLNLYACLVPIVSNLICVPSNPSRPHDAIPSLRDIADLTGRLLRKFGLQLGVTMGDEARSEVLIFGYCHKTGRNRIFRLSPSVDTTLDPPFSVLCLEEDTRDRRHVALLGVCRDEMARRISAIRAAETSGIVWWRAPETALRQIIDEEADKSVGGPMQMARGGPHGLNVFARLRPVEPGKPPATIAFLGVDLFDDVGLVGPCQCSMMAMA